MAFHLDGPIKRAPLKKTVLRIEAQLKVLGFAAQRAGVVTPVLTATGDGFAGDWSWRIVYSCIAH